MLWPWPLIVWPWPQVLHLISQPLLSWPSWVILLGPSLQRIGLRTQQPGFTKFQEVDFKTTLPRSGSWLGQVHSSSLPTFLKHHGVAATHHINSTAMFLDSFWKGKRQRYSALFSFSFGNVLYLVNSSLLRNYAHLLYTEIMLTTLYIYTFCMHYICNTFTFIELYYVSYLCCLLNTYLTHSFVLLFMH